MFKILKKIINKLLFEIRLFLAGEYQKANIYKKYFGVKFGKNVRITGKIGFGSEPYLIEIGDNVTLTQSIVFHTHDGGVGIFRKEYPGLNIYGRIIIGNNVFVGSHTIFLPNVKVGDNVVIGAGSVVSKDIPSNSVAVGVAAKVIKSIEEYKEKSLKNGIFVYSKDIQKRKLEILEKINSLK